MCFGVHGAPSLVKSYRKLAHHEPGRTRVRLELPLNLAPATDPARTVGRSSDGTVRMCRQSDGLPERPLAQPYKTAGISIKRGDRLRSDLWTCASQAGSSSLMFPLNRVNVHMTSLPVRPNNRTTCDIQIMSVRLTDGMSLDPLLRGVRRSNQEAPPRPFTHWFVNNIELFPSLETAQSAIRLAETQRIEI